MGLKREGQGNCGRQDSMSMSQKREPHEEPQSEELHCMPSPLRLCMIEKRQLT